MQQSPVLDNIRKYINLDPAEEHYLLDKVTERSFSKGERINAEGEVNRYTNYIVKGSVRVYYVDQDGNEHVIQLGIADWWTGDYISFISQQPGYLNVEALEQTLLYSFSYDNLQEIYREVPKMERFFRLLVQSAYAAFQNRVLQSLSMDAESRYIAFREKYPAMDQQISQKHIASYLGMSAEFLSKVKKRIVQKERSKKRLL
ncbi:Crp/Fnr family transcriptional regulator [Flavihumibacter rivuli]|uniref:Crp/Fnr family transcriptional regulator n=1 Tax=Flavihumibacter rivuli TaxID=2838156 RepID=UPI001BDE0D92|nr:Crp/Fnr family transcriptional regulator [Flavihumibacter rivuli]ULQ58414.1 Crp/Fnr family transcriptional regulator [Flavihumibacter rivuli]